MAATSDFKCIVGPLQRLRCPGLSNGTSAVPPVFNKPGGRQVVPNPTVATILSHENRYFNGIEMLAGRTRRQPKRPPSRYALNSCTARLAWRRPLRPLRAISPDRAPTRPGHGTPGSPSSRSRPGCSPPHPLPGRVVLRVGLLGVVDLVALDLQDAASGRSSAARGSRARSRGPRPGTRIDGQAQVVVAGVERHEVAGVQQLRGLRLPGRVLDHRVDVALRRRRRRAGRREVHAGRAAHGAVAVQDRQQRRLAGGVVGQMASRNRSTTSWMYFSRPSSRGSTPLKFTFVADELPAQRRRPAGTDWCRDWSRSTRLFLSVFGIVGASKSSMICWVIWKRIVWKWVWLVVVCAGPAGRTRTGTIPCFCVST